MPIKQKTVNLTDIIHSDLKARKACNALVNSILNEENQFKTDVSPEEALVYLQSVGVKFTGKQESLPQAIKVCEVDSSLLLDLLERAKTVENTARTYAKGDIKSILNAGGNTRCDFQVFDVGTLYGLAQELMRISLSGILTKGLQTYIKEEIKEEVVFHVFVRKLNQHRAINCGVSLDLLHIDYWPVESESRNTIKTTLAFVGNNLRSSLTPKWHRLPDDVLENNSQESHQLEFSLLVATFDQNKPAIQYNAPSQRELLSMIALLM